MDGGIFFPHLEERTTVKIVDKNDGQNRRDKRLGKEKVRWKEIKKRAIRILGRNYERQEKIV